MSQLMLAAGAQLLDLEFMEPSRDAKAGAHERLLERGSSGP